MAMCNPEAPAVACSGNVCMRCSGEEAVTPDSAGGNPVVTP